MTGWTLNAAVVTIGAAVVLLPDPAEIRSAFEYNRNHDIIIKVAEVPEEPGEIEVELTNAVSTSAFLVESEPLADCISRKDLETMANLIRCVPQLMNKIKAHDEAARYQLGIGMEVSPDPKIENMRLAVTQLCRAKWAATGGDTNTGQLPECNTVLSAVAY